MCSPEGNPRGIPDDLRLAVVCCVAVATWTFLPPGAPRRALPLLLAGSAGAGPARAVKGKAVDEEPIGL